MDISALAGTSNRRTKVGNMIRVVEVVTEDIECAFSLISDWLQDALADDISYTVEDIKQDCLQKMFDLRLVYIGEELTGFFISAFIPAPQGRVLYGAWLGGRDLDLWVKDGLEIIKDWARDCGCIMYSFIGRDAWKRLIGFKPKGAFYYEKL